MSPGPGPGPDFIHYEFGCFFWSGSGSNFESGSESGIYQAGPGPCPGPDYILFESGSGFYQACPGRRSNSTNTPKSWIMVTHLKWHMVCLCLMRFP